jgi:hypothetical protein
VERIGRDLEEVSRGGIAVASCPSIEQLLDAKQLLDAEQLLAERLLDASYPSTESLLRRLLAEQLLDAEQLLAE